MTDYPWGTEELSFSLLKHVAESPATFYDACLHGIEATPSMMLGTLVHWYLLGGPEERRPVIAPARNRRSKDWTIWTGPRLKANPRLEIHTEDEAEEAETIADAIRTAPHNRALHDEWIAGATYERPLRWSMKGIPFRTRGVDVFHGVRARLVDFKTTRSSRPDLFRRQAGALYYAVQVAIYREGLRQNGYEVREAGIFATCTVRPYVSTFFSLSRQALEAGDVVMWEWIDRVNAGLSTGHWPGYSRTPVPLDTEIFGEADLPEESE